MTTRTNICINPSFEVDTTGWTTMNGGTLTVDTTTFWSGSKCAKTSVLTSGALVISYGFNGVTNTGTSSAWPVTPGQVWTISFYAKAVSSGSVGIRSVWLNSSNSFLSDNGNPGLTSVNGTTWTRIVSTVTVPSGAAKMSFAPIGNTNVYMDAVLVEQASAVADYFDGSTTLAGYTTAWTGTPNASTSTATQSDPNTISADLTGSGAFTAALTPGPVSAPLTGTGTLSSSVSPTVAAALMGSGTVGASVSPALSAALTGSGSLGATASPSLSADLAGSGALSAAVSGGAVTMSVALTGTGTLGATLEQAQSLSAPLSGSGALGASVASTGSSAISASLSGTGTVGAYVVPPITVAAGLSSEGGLYAELVYDAPPTPLEDQPLGKLSDFTVHSSATSLDPSQGNGGVPSVSATFIRGKRPEAAMGAQATVSHGAIGTWKGEVTKLSLPQQSERAPLTIDTALTLLNRDLRLFPHMPAAAGTTTAAEAVDYWTQTAGIPYDVIEGDVAFYASGYGHGFGYGAGLGSRKFYEQSYTAATVSGRRVLAYGSASLCTVHELKKNEKQPFVPVALTGSRRIVLGSGFAGTGNGTTDFIFDNGHTLTLAVSGTAVTVSYNGTALSTATLAGSGWAYASLEKIGETVWAVRLTADATSPVQLSSIALPASLHLTGVQHTGDSTRYRYGTFLSVADTHPAAAPTVQKDFTASGFKSVDFVSGFEGNVWDKLNEFCAVAELDILFQNEKLTLAPRSNALVHPSEFKDLTPSFERRAKFQQVAVMDQRSKATRTLDALLWRADSVYQVAAREVFETTISTKNSILALSQPVCVNGIEPFPYKTGAGEYVVTGADGYIVSPQWWADNGGKVEVELTDKEGEILLRIIAPTVDTVRAPYRISEGAGDRAALYVCGAGIVNDPKEVHVSTGAVNASEGFDKVFDSPFCSGPAQVYGTAMAMAAQYSAGFCDYTVDVPGQADAPTALGVYPAGSVFSAGNRAVRLMDAQQGKSSVSGTGQAHTTVGMTEAFFPNRLVGQRPSRTIREAEISPLERSA